MQPAMNVEPVVLEGKTVRLEPLDEVHAESLAEVATDDLFAYHFPPRELTEDGFREQITGLRAAPDFCPFAQVPTETGRAVGITSFLGIHPEHRALEIGFTWLAKPWQGTALNPEAKYLLLAHAFEVLGAIRVQLKTDERNLQSQAAIAKLGAVREGTLRNQMILADGYHRNTVMFSITDDEWPAVRDPLQRRVEALTSTRS